MYVYVWVVLLRSVRAWDQEIGYLTSTADELFETILALEGAGGGKGGGASSFDTLVRTVLNDLLERYVCRAAGARGGVPVGGGAVARARPRVTNAHAGCRRNLS